MVGRLLSARCTVREYSHVQMVEMMTKVVMMVVILMVMVE